MSFLLVLTLVTIFLGWLYLFCGLSRIKCQMARAFILEILGLAHQHPILDDLNDSNFPKDIRTSIKSLDITPDLDRQICCPTCFSLYTTFEAPWLCSYKKLLKAQECSEEMFVMGAIYRGFRNTGTNHIQPSYFKNASPVEVGHPCNVYVTQKLSSWLRWFLGKSTNEDEIAKWFDELYQHPGDKIYNIQQSAAWKDIQWPPLPPTNPQPLNLFFSLFVDWFNR